MQGGAELSCPYISLANGSVSMLFVSDRIHSGPLNGAQLSDLCQTCISVT